MSKLRLKVALLQMPIVAGEPDENFAKLEEMLHKAVQAEDKPDVLVFPEMWNTGYALDRIQLLADEEGERTRNLLSAFARTHDVHLVAGSIAEKRGGQVTNRMYVFDRQGQEQASYDKLHLFRLMDEEKHLTAGETRGLFQLEGERAGMMICYDIRFPELARRLALDGAKVLFVPAEWPSPRLFHWRTLLIARAIENQMYVVACNRMGKSDGTHFFGHSMIIDPWGEIVAEAGEEETIVQAELDFGLVNEVRGRIPVFEDRRPSLY